jgi:hypothetical protein
LTVTAGKLGVFFRGEKRTGRVDTSAAEQQHGLVEQTGAEPCHLERAAELAEPVEQLLHRLRHPRMGPCRHREHLKANEQAVGLCVVWRHDGAMAEEHSQIEHARSQAQEPFRDALGGDVVPASDLCEAHTPLHLYDGVEDVVDVVGLAGKNVRGQHPLARSARVTASERHHDVAVPAKDLQAPGHAGRCELNAIVAAAPTATGLEQRGDLGGVTAGETVLIGDTVEW